MSVFAGEAPRTKALNAVLLLILLGLIGLPFALFFRAVLPMAADGTLDRALITLVEEGAANPLEISELVGHDVTRVCIAQGFGSAVELARAAGVQPSQAPKDEIPMEQIGIVAVGVSSVTFGTISRHLFGGRYSGVTSTRPFCQDGSRLALVFETASPPRNGRIIDLAITDPAIFIGAAAQ